jgi:hypothetical protein
VPVVGAAASAQQPNRREHLPEPGVITAERNRVGLVQLLRLVEFGVTERRSVDPKAPTRFRASDS